MLIVKADAVLLSVMAITFEPTLPLIRFVALPVPEFVTAAGVVDAAVASVMTLPSAALSVTLPVPVIPRSR